MCVCCEGDGTAGVGSGGGVVAVSACMSGTRGSGDVLEMSVVRGVGGVCCRTWIGLDIPAFVSSLASLPAGPHGRHAQKMVNRVPIACRLYRLECRLCRLESFGIHIVM